MLAKREMEKRKCEQVAIFRYTWAGRNEAFCCAIHGEQINAVAQAIGYPLQFIQLSADELLEASCENEEPIGE